MPPIVAPMLEPLRRQVHQATVRLHEDGLADPYHGVLTAYDERRRLAVARPRGPAVDQLSPERLLVVSGRTGQVVEGGAAPMPVVAAHDRIHDSFPGIGAVVSVDSRYATMWAQAGRPIPCLGAAHAELFAGPVPIAPRVGDEVPAENFFEAAAERVVELFAGEELDPAAVPGCLVHQWGCLVWGGSVEEALRHATSLERIAECAHGTLLLNPAAGALSPATVARHRQLVDRQDPTTASGRRRRPIETTGP